MCFWLIKRLFWRKLRKNHKCAEGRIRFQKIVFSPFVQKTKILTIIRTLCRKNKKMTCSILFYVGVVSVNSFSNMEFVKNFTHPDFQAKSFTPQKCVICDIFFSQINSVNASNINNLGIFWL